MNLYMKPEEYVYISNKGCRRAYQPGPRTGNCECPEGSCWYEAQVRKRDLGREIEKYEFWLKDAAGRSGGSV